MGTAAGGKGKARRAPGEAELAELAEVARDPHGAQAGARLAKALASKQARVVARAAQLIADHRLEGQGSALREAFERLCQAADPAKADPNCVAKLAALEALDFTEDSDPSPFTRGARYVQLQAAWGPPVDAGAGVRVRGLLGLARQGHSELDLYAAEALTDPEAPVRQGALQALAHHGGRSGAALALLKLRLGDEEPTVTLEAMGALLSLEPEWGLGELRRRLFGKDEGMRELAALALGGARGEAPLQLLLQALGEAVRPEERAVILRGVGLHRSDRALERLLEVVREGSAEDAEAAVAALGARRFEPGVEKVAREAAKGRAGLAKALEAAFPESG